MDGQERCSGCMLAEQIMIPKLFVLTTSRLSGDLELFHILSEYCAMADVHTLLREDHEDEFAGNSVFIGSSPHNQRIERWWRYLKMIYTSTCVNLLKDMRDSGILDVSDPMHMECLQFCFIPVIQRDLFSVMDTWNNHRIRKQRTVCPSGKPSFLYDNPALFGGQEMKLLIDYDVLDLCTEMYPEYNLEMSSSDEFAEAAFLLMLLHDFHLPETLEDAKELFINLLNAIKNLED